MAIYNKEAYCLSHIRTFRTRRKHGQRRESESGVEICVQRHRTDARGEKSTTTPDEGSERKGVSRAQGGEGGAPPQDPPQDQPQALHVCGGGGRSCFPENMEEWGRRGFTVLSCGTSESGSRGWRERKSLNTEHWKWVGHTGVGRREHRVSRTEAKLTS